jgi:peptidoglycan/LPS O-acetylase OafA/YrhL
VAVVFLASKKYALELHWAELASGLAASLLIYAVICQDQSAKTGLYAKVSDMLARISYTFYLTHMPFMVFLFAAFGGVWAIRSVSAGSLLQFFGSYLATLAWACIVYWLFESRTDAVREAVMRLIGTRLLPTMPPE